MIGPVDTLFLYSFMFVAGADGAPIEHFRAHACSRGWAGIRMLSSSESSELFWAGHGDGEESRHVDFMWPYWNILDCTPEGRPVENAPRLDYG
jgi:predicted dithiol-disulfide oxidoreductase (DUF899 family)